MIRRQTLFATALVLLTCLAFLGCEKEITVDLPTVEEKVVIEGTIEPGQPPVILLSTSQGYFEPTDLTSLESLYLKGATCALSNGTTTVELDEICASELPEDLLEEVAGILGFPPEVLAEVDLCVYTSPFNTDIWGEEGVSYELTVEYEDHYLTASTKINEVVPLDSTWFELAGNSDSLGFLHAMLSDPDTIGNAYRWFAQRLNQYEPWSENAGQIKDAGMIAPLGSVGDDEFFNGLSFEFAYFRGVSLGSDKEDDFNQERGFYKVGDTVAVRGCVIDYDAFLHIYAVESQVANSGSPFAVPANIPTNVQGGLGAFVGYGIFNDTIICQP